MIENSKQKLTFGGRLTKSGPILNTIHDLMQMVSSNPDQSLEFKNVLIYLYFTRTDLTTINFIVSHLKFTFINDHILQVVGLYSSLDYESTKELMNNILEYYDNKIILKHGGTPDVDKRKRYLFNEYSGYMVDCVMQVITTLNDSSLLCFSRLLMFADNLTNLVREKGIISYSIVIPELLRRWKLLPAVEFKENKDLVISVISRLSECIGESLAIRSVWPTLFTASDSLAFNPFESESNISIFLNIVQIRDDSIEVEQLSNLFCHTSTILEAVKFEEMKTISLLGKLQNRISTWSIASDALWYLASMKYMSLTNKFIISAMTDCIKMEPLQTKQKLAKRSSKFRLLLDTNHLILSNGLEHLVLPHITTRISSYKPILNFPKLQWEAFPRFFKQFLSQFDSFKLARDCHLFEAVGYIWCAMTGQVILNDDDITILLNKNNDLISELVGVYLIKSNDPYRLDVDIMELLNKKMIFLVIGALKNNSGLVNSDNIAALLNSEFDGVRQMSLNAIEGTEIANDEMVRLHMKDLIQ